MINHLQSPHISHCIPKMGEREPYSLSLPLAISSRILHQKTLFAGACEFNSSPECKNLHPMKKYSLWNDTSRSTFFSSPQCHKLIVLDVRFHSSLVPSNLQYFSALFSLHYFSGSFHPLQKHLTLSNELGQRRAGEGGPS